MIALLDSRLFRYVLTGGTAAVVDIGSFALLGLTATPLFLAAVMSFSLAVIANYLLSSRFVFFQRTTLRGFGLFVAAALGGLGVNVGVTMIGSVAFGIFPVIAKVAGCGIAFLFNFWVNSRFVYRSGVQAER